MTKMMIGLMRWIMAAMLCLLLSAILYPQPASAAASGTQSGALEKQPPRSRFDEMDLDMNGTVSLKEFLDHERLKFKRIDKNRDRRLTSEEMVLHEKEKRMNQGREAGSRDDRFTQLDSDRSGSISLKEYLADEERKFREMDMNRDRLLIRSEMKKKMQDAQPRKQDGKK